MIGHETFCAQTRPFSSRLCQYTEVQNMVIGKSICKCTSTASFWKDNCVVWVDGVVYCKTIVFRGGVSRYFTVNGKHSLLSKPGHSNTSTACMSE
ncbi:hypothetical protein CEXT_208531 [Caerostris extrusa]|uniref:Uncharacterized protein n=1 Tax=Caerostris extrusa TaxID=172846 RepID=A0AAV4XFL0_CAEEX|nr:hypothetical protein CEXT_208531 [Caerostris extrusa]